MSDLLNKIDVQSSDKERKRKKRGVPTRPQEGSGRQKHQFH